MQTAFTMYDVLWEPDPLVEWGAGFLLLMGCGLVVVAGLVRGIMHGRAERSSEGNAESVENSVAHSPDGAPRPVLLGIVGTIICAGLLVKQVLDFAFGLRAVLPGAVLVGWLFLSCILWLEIKNAEKDPLGRDSDGRFSWIVWMGPRALVLLLSSALGCLMTAEIMRSRPTLLQAQDWARRGEFEVETGTITENVASKTNAYFTLSGRRFYFAKDFPPGMIAGGDLRYGRIWSWTKGMVRTEVGRRARVRHHEGRVLQVELLGP